MATREELIAELSRRKRMAALEQSKANIAADEEGYKATSGMSGMEKFRAGIGAGMVGVGDRAVNLLLPKALERGRFTEEAIKGRKAMEEDLTSTGAGAAGKLVGELVATAPVGGAVGALGKGAATGLGATRTLQAASKLPGAARVARAGGAALEGAGAGLLTSDVGEGAKAAGTGALMGGAFSGATEALGAGINKLRPKITDQARRVMEETGTFIPVSQALPEESIVRQGYSGVVANLPGGGQKLRGQYNQAVNAARDTALAGSKNVPSALPHNVPLRSIYDPSAGDTQFDMMRNAKKAWDTAFDDINQATVKGYRVPQDVADMITQRSKGSVKIPAPGQPMTGREMLDFQMAVNQIARETPGGVLDRASKKRLQTVANGIDNLMETQLKGKLDQFGDDLGEKYAANKAGWKNWQTIQQAAKSAPGGKFTMRQLERAGAKKGNAPVQEFGEDAAEALQRFPSNQGIFQTAAALGLVGSGGLVGFAAPGEDASIGQRLASAAAGAAGMYGGSKAVASPMAQRIVAQYGDEASRKMVKKLRNMGRTFRRGTVVGTNEEE